MIIVGKDFKIECVDFVHTLFLLKSKLELKEDSKDNFKLGGYFLYIGSAFLAVIRYRKNKKYSGKESVEDMFNYIKDFEVIEKFEETTINSIYDPVLKLQKYWKH